MTRHGKTRQRGSQGRLGALLRRVFLGPPEELDYPESVPTVTHLPPTAAETLEAEGYLREYIHPIVGDRPFDQEPDAIIKFQGELTREELENYRQRLDQTRFDLIRVQPYLERGNDGDERPARQMDTTGDGGHDPGSGGLRLRPVIYPRVLPGADASRERGIPEDAPAERGLADVRGWFDPAPRDQEGDQALVPARSARPGGYRNPDS